MTNSRNHMVELIRMNLRDIGDLDATAKLDLHVSTVRKGSGGATVHEWHRAEWIRWLPSAFPELAEEPELGPYKVPADLKGPEEVPWLTARTMEGRTIEVWWQSVFTHEHTTAAMVCLILMNEIGPYENRGDQPLTDWAKKASKREQAGLWNKVMARMGYTEDA